MKEDVIDEICITRLDSLVKCNGVFFHVEQQRYLFARPRLVVQQFGCQSHTAFIVGRSCYLLERDARLTVELLDNETTYLLLRICGDADFLLRPVTMYLVCW